MSRETQRRWLKHILNQNFFEGDIEDTVLNNEPLGQIEIEMAASPKAPYSINGSKVPIVGSPEIMRELYGGGPCDLIREYRDFKSQDF